MMWNLRWVGDLKIKLGRFISVASSEVNIDFNFVYCVVRLQFLISNWLHDPRILAIFKSIIVVGLAWACCFRMIAGIFIIDI